MSFPALIDPLTHALRRDGLADRIQQMALGATVHDVVFSVLFIDIDHFKSINDGYGHLRGDAALKEVAQRMQAALRTEDQLFRYSGDEFLVLAAGADLSAACALGNRLLTAVSSTPLAGVPPLNCTLSIGVACFPEDGRDVAALIGAADKRTYLAKRSGRNRMVASDNHLAASVKPWERESSRLVEREETVEQLRELVTNTAAGVTGGIVLQGPRGVGFTRLTREAALLAKQVGVRVLTLAGAGTNLRYSTIERSMAHLMPAANAGVGVSSAGQGAIDHVSDRVTAWFAEPAPGLLLLDNWDGFDSASVSLLSSLVTQRRQSGGTLGTLVVVPDAREGERIPARPPSWSAAEWPVVDVMPLSRAGSLQVIAAICALDAEPGFATWAYHLCGGLPALVGRMFDAMHADGLISMRDQRIVPRPDYRQLAYARVRPDDVPHNLGMRPLALIGRDEAIDQVIDGIDAGRLVTLTGPGGIGKSALAMQAATECRYRFTDGAWFVELAQVKDRPLFAFTVAKTMGIALESGQEPVAALAASLGHRNVLLVLDNLEQVADEAALILAQLLAANPRLTVLATSRVRLSVHNALPEEVVFPVTALVNEDEETGSAPSNAARLFALRAKAARPGFVLGADNLSEVETICRRLDGLPLAIELAAARVRALSLADILSRLDERLALLGSQAPSYQAGRIDAAASAITTRRTLRDTIASSVELLSQSARSTFAELSVVGGRFDVPTANALLGRALEDDIVALADASLIDEKLIDDVPTFLMLETVREYGQERLRESGRWLAAKSRHVAFLAEAAAMGRSEPVAAAQRAWMKKMDGLSGDMREALTWATGDEAVIADVEKALTAFGDSQPWWELRGRWMEVLTWWDRFQPALANIPATPARAAATVNAARAAFMLARYQQCEALYQDALDVASDCDDMQSAATALTGLGNHANFHHQTADARTFYTQALARYRTIGLSTRVAYCLNTLGLIARQAGELKGQLKYYKEAAELRESIGDEFGLAQSHLCLGTAYNDIGDAAEAVPLFGRANAVLRRYADSRFLTMSLSQEIVSFTLLGQYARGLANVPEIVKRARDSRDRRRCLFTMAVAVAPIAAVANGEAGELAAALSAATYALCKREGIQLLAPDQAMMQMDRENLRQTLPDDRYRAAVKRGETWTMDEALDALYDFTRPFVSGAGGSRTSTPS